MSPEFLVGINVGVIAGVLITMGLYAMIAREAQRRQSEMPSVTVLPPTSPEVAALQQAVRNLVRATFGSEQDLTNYVKHMEETK